MDWLSGVTEAADTWRKHLLGGVSGAGKQLRQATQQFEIPSVDTFQDQWSSLMPIPQQWANVPEPTQFSFGDQSGYEVPYMSPGNYGVPGFIQGNQGVPGVNMAELDQKSGWAWNKPAIQPGQQTPGASNYDGSEGSDTRGLSGTYRWNDLISRAAQATGVPENVIRAIMGIESAGDEKVVSVAGAMGLMQVMPFHFQNGENGMDPWTNVLKGAQILADNYGKFGSWTNAAAAYLGAIQQNPDGSWSPSAAPDAYGTTGHLYVQLFQKNLDYLEGMSTAANPRLTPALSAAQSVIGLPYLWGGRDTGGFDCSGLVEWAYGQAGVDMRGTAAMQYQKTARIAGNQLQAGDLVFFSFPASATNAAETSHINHVAIYLGNGKILHATSDGDMVRVSDYNDWYQQYTYGFGRVPTGGSNDPVVHSGVDIPAAQGSLVESLKPGEVVMVGEDDQYGNFVVISDGEIICLYGHLDPKVKVREGQQVRAGQPIGVVGSGEGLSTGPHIHLDIADVQGNSLNPWDYIGRYSS